MLLDRYLNGTDNTLMEWMRDNELCHHNNAHNKFKLRPISSLICYLAAQGCTAVICLLFGDIYLMSNELGYQSSSIPKGLEAEF